MELEGKLTGELEEIMEFDVNDFTELSDEELDQVAGGAGQLPATKPCPQCGQTMSLQGMGRHYVYYCKACDKTFKVN